MDARIFLNTTFERIDAAWLAAHPGVKVIGSPTTGLDHIDLEACQAAGVKVVSLQGERRFLDTITSTAEHTMGLILSLARNYRTGLHGHRTLGHKLSGKTLGIVGNRGRIGKQMKRLGKAFGMKVIGCDKGGKILDLLRQSDIITIHIPLVGNEGWWKAIHFKLMKRSSYFINTSRTRIMEGGALAKALREGWIAGAALDFTDDPELVALAKTDQRLILTDHLGGNTEEDRALTDEFIQAKVNRCLST